MKEFVSGLVELLKAPYGMGFLVIMSLIFGPAIIYGLAFKYFADSQASGLRQLHDDLIQVVRCTSSNQLNATVPLTLSKGE